ncbi:MAG TPA: PAS-domain containing protein [Sphingomonas sp.]|nr:PAS-domain containing protein [Sphingomonas sp.]
MMEIGWQAVLAGVVLFGVLAAAIAILFVGLRARQAARQLSDDHARFEAMLAAAPALAVLVGADGRIAPPDRLAGWLGLARQPRYLSELGEAEAGLNADDLARLVHETAAAQKSGRTFDQPVRARESNRTLMIHGTRAPAGVGGPGSALLWFFDATDARVEVDAAEAEAARLGTAFEALTGLIEVAPLPMWYRGPDLRLAMVNSAYVHAVEGRDAEDVVARGIELVEGAGLGGPLAGAAKARDTGVPHEQTMPATIGGARRMLHVHDIPLPTGGVAGFAVDIDELEQARARMRRLGEAQRAMLDRLSAGVAQFTAERTLAFCNLPFRRLFAMRNEWLADRPEFDRVLERMREANRVPEVRDFPNWKDERRAWFNADTDAIEENWHLPGGTHLRVLAQPLPDGGLLLVFEDRTEEVQLASARDTLLRVRTATFDNLFEALGVFAADGRLQLWNNRFREVWGFDHAFLAGHPRVDALAEKAAPSLASPARASLIGELVRSATVERQQRGGRAAFADGRHFELAAVPLPDGNALFTMLDISDSRRIERALRERAEALEAADRVKTAFVANMSYELRTPLTSIQGFAEMLHGGYAGTLGKEADGYVAAILDSTAKLGLLIDDVLDLTQQAATAPELDRTSVDLTLVARSAAEALGPFARERAIDFVVEVDPSTGTIDGDARRLQQVIEHMLRHAIAGTPERGRVLLHTDGGAQAARIVVSDDGPGMNAEVVARAFDRAEEGAAVVLGLPLAKQVVEAHGGTIDLVSEPGEGTLIVVELPR